MISGVKRKTIVTGHFGSGKTEFSVSLAIRLAHAASPQEPIALIDLDIVKAYFRSREKRELLESSGVSVYGSTYDKEITAEVPALGATIRTPLEDNNCRVIVDVGGNSGGALVINQFSKYFDDNETMVCAVVNINRPDTTTFEAVSEHISAIEATLRLEVTHIVSNTHMLRETTAQDILKGYRFCESFCEKIGKKLLCTCYPDGIVDTAKLTEAGIISTSLMPMGLHMRPSWLDS